MMLLWHVHNHFTYSFHISQNKGCMLVQFGEMKPMSQKTIVGSRIYATGVVDFAVVL